MSARTKERRERIVTLAKQDGFVSVVELAQLFQVSEVTIRSDLDVLEPAESRVLFRVCARSKAASGKRPWKFGSHFGY